MLWKTVPGPHTRFLIILASMRESCKRDSGYRSGVIWNGIPFETSVIPAQAGIRPVGAAFPMARGLDSRLRGNDRTRERQSLAADTSNRDIVRVLLIDPLEPDVQRDGQRQSTGKAAGCEIHDAIGDEAAALQRGAQHAVEQVPGHGARKRNDGATPPA